MYMMYMYICYYDVGRIGSSIDRGREEHDAEGPLRVDITTTMTIIYYEYEYGRLGGERGGRIKRRVAGWRK